MAKKTDLSTTTLSNAHITRESWLDDCVVQLRGFFTDCGLTLPEKIRCSMGYPPQGNASKRRLSGNLPSEASTGKYHEIYIRPELEDAFEVALALTVELVSTLLPPDSGRGPDYRRVAIEVGLKGNMLAPTAGRDLRGRLNAIEQALGPLNHFAVKSDYRRPKRPRKPQKGRLLKAACPNCGGIIRVTQSLIEKSGIPDCHKDKVPFELDKPKDEKPAGEATPERADESSDADSDTVGYDTETPAQFLPEEVEENLSPPLPPSEQEAPQKYADTSSDADTVRYDSGMSAQSPPEKAEENPSPPSPPSEQEIVPVSGQWIAQFDFAPPEETLDLLRARGKWVKQSMYWVGTAIADIAELQAVVEKAKGRFYLGENIGQGTSP